MKYLNKNATAILDRITEGLVNAGDHRKIDKTPGFMALSVELISTKPWLVSLAHYGELNGDLMRDPEMIFYKSAGRYYPTYYRNDYVGIEQRSVIFGENASVQYKPGQMADQASFANIWMQNIKEQQGI